MGGNASNISTEYGLKFHIDWLRGQKTGFFVDQRENRSLLEKYAKGRKLLNMFCYTGGFSIYALRGGAEIVHSVDSSSKAIDLTNANVEINFPGDTRHTAYAEDAFDFLDRMGNNYNLIILDPPAFAKHRDSLRNALIGYRRLNAKAIEKIQPGGILFTFSCSQVVSKENFRLAVFTAAAQSGRKVRILHQLTQPADEGASSGRSPKRLKTLFKKIMASRQQAAPQVAAADNTVVSRRSMTQQQPSIANAAQPASQSQPSSAAQPLASQPKLKLSSLGITFSTLRNMGKKQTVVKEEEIITDTTANRQFSEDDLQLQWMMMCNRMPQQMRALASRMKNIQPKLLDFPNVEVVVENEVLLSDVQQIKGRIRATLAKELGNGNLTLTVRLAKAEEVKAILSKREVLAELIKTNSGVKRLIESLHLEMG